ncbi:acyltransferase family protein [Roseomonas sp. GCM10028921]
MNVASAPSSLSAAPAAASLTGGALPAGGGHRLVFANQLRGLAALAVVVSHLIGVFWGAREVVSWATSTPVQPGDAPGVFQLVSQPWFNFGPFGVSVFFLISGLVIPISLGHHSQGSFLLARLLRIYPTYLACFAVNLGAAWLASRHFGQPFNHGWSSIVANALLIPDLKAQLIIDLVNWTLCIELKFYVLMALLAPAIRRGSVSVLFAIGFGLLAANLMVQIPDIQHALRGVPEIARGIRFASPYLVFMLIGVLFNYRLRGLLSLRDMAAGMAGLGLLFVACWRSSAFAEQFPVVTINYAYGLALFAGLFALRRHIRPFRPLDALADISYPLYLIHSLVGYTLLRALMITGGMGYAAALAITLPACLLVATLLHLGVERWSITAGKRLARRAPRATVSPASATAG